MWVRVGCEFSVCEAGAVVWGYLGPLGAGTALLAVLVVLQAGTAVLNTPVSMCWRRRSARPEVGARCFVCGLWLGQDFLLVSGAPLARWQGLHSAESFLFRIGCSFLAFSCYLGLD